MSGREMSRVLVDMIEIDRLTAEIAKRDADIKRLKDERAKTVSLDRADYMLCCCEKRLRKANAEISRLKARVAELEGAKG